MLYIAFLVLLLSFFSDTFEQIVGFIKHGISKVYFGLYMVLTGVSTATVASWRAIQDSEREDFNLKMSYEFSQISRKSWRIAHLTSGAIFTMEGIFFLIYGLGQLNGWWINHDIFQGVLPRIILIIMLLIPNIIGYNVRCVIIAWVYAKKNKPIR